jgi:prefoldin subunit 5
MGKVNWILVGIVALALVFVGYLWKDGQANKQMLKMQENQHKQEIDSLKKQIDLLEVSLVESRQAIVQLQEDARKNREELGRQLADLRKATPDKLVDEAKRILNTDEIWLVQNHIEFSIAAFRENVVRLYDWENFTLVREPNYDKQLAEKDTLIAGLEQKVKLLEQQQKSIEGWNKDLKDFISKQNRKTFLQKVMYVVGAFSIGYVLASVGK